MQDFSIIETILDASLGVMSVLIILLFMSVYSWGVILKKYYALRKNKKDLRKFNEIFWKNYGFQTIYKELQKSNTGLIGSLFRNATQTFFKIEKELQKVSKERICEIVVGDFEGAIQKEDLKLNNDLNSLSTISATAPFIGLFGTVYGILIAFWGLGIEQGASIGEIAPSIAEALIATAMGLFVAIPAEMAHNKFKNDAFSIHQQYLNIEDEIVNMINKSSMQKYKKQVRNKK